MFNLDGSPHWVMTMNRKCPCGTWHYDTDGEILKQLPPHIMNLYPVNPTWAKDRGQCHFHKSTTDNVFDELMITYTNGNMASKLLLKAINQEYKNKLAAYYTMCKAHGETPMPYPKKDGEFIKQWPPQGPTIWKKYQEAATVNCHRHHHQCIICTTSTSPISL